MNSKFINIPEGPVDPILGLNIAFKNDKNPNKINLGVGAYRTEEGNPLILSSVKKAENIIMNSKEYNKEYLPIDGYPLFNTLAAKLLFGEELIKKLGKKIITVQALSGTGSLRIGAEFIHKFMPNSTVYIPEPTWPNHKGVFSCAYVPVKTYRYYKDNDIQNPFDFDGLCEDLKNAPSGSIIILHACAHNPTGIDPNEEQWDTIANIMRNCNLFPFFDCAYQGFASGDLDKDAYAIRLFANMGMELFAAQSFAKNFGLYGERIGAFHIVSSNENVNIPILSQLKLIIRPFYSNPPLHGALIVSIILNSPELFEEWKLELKMMAGRIKSMRQQLYDALKEKGIDWPHILTQIGMFSYTGLTAKQCEVLINKYHIYLTSNGRISLPGLSSKTVPILANAIEDILHNNIKDSRL
jgi:aspartate aminotransferase